MRNGTFTMLGGTIWMTEAQYGRYLSALHEIERNSAQN
jgi:hypothetical protein